MTKRPCSRVTCAASATSTLTYVYADSMIVLGPLSVKADPHSYDLCADHSARLSAPQGWTIIRYTDMSEQADPEPSKGTLFGL